MVSIDIMKCNKCGFENKKGAKFCTKCGNSLNQRVSAVSGESSNSKVIIYALLAVIIILVAVIGYLALSMDSDSSLTNDNSYEGQLVYQNDSASDYSDSEQSELIESKSWESIGYYSGSGSGTQTISVPSGKIMVKLSSFPIKNYATNHLYVSGPNGEYGGVDWGPTSDVETRSDSFTFTSSSKEIFTIDYNETVSWEVEFFRYQ